MRFELKSPVKTIEDFIKRFTPSRLTSGSNSSSSSSLATNRSSTKGCSSMLSSPSAESTLTNLEEEVTAVAVAAHAFSPMPPTYDGKIPNPEGADLRYEAESPDEAALVYAARAYKCSLVGRLPDQMTVDLPHLGKLNFELLHTLGFDSTRKRMSVVVKHPLTEQITVYTKGADSVIMDLIKSPNTGRTWYAFIRCRLTIRKSYFPQANTLLQWCVDGAQQRSVAHWRVALGTPAVVECDCPVLSCIALSALSRVFVVVALQPPHPPFAPHLKPFH